MKTIYNKNSYHAWVDKQGVVIVTRSGHIGDRQVEMITHVGEKHPAQDWREVQLMGCPVEIKREIAKAHLTLEKHAVT